MLPLQPILCLLKLIAILPLISLGVGRGSSLMDVGLAFFLFTTLKSFITLHYYYYNELHASVYVGSRSLSFLLLLSVTDTTKHKTVTISELLRWLIFLSLGVNYYWSCIFFCASTCPKQIHVESYLILYLCASYMLMGFKARYPAGVNSCSSIGFTRTMLIYTSEDLFLSVTSIWMSIPVDGGISVLCDRHRNFSFQSL